MKNATVTILAGKASDPGEFARLYETARANSAHLSVLVVGAVPPLPAYAYQAGLYGSVDFPAEWQENVRENAEALSGTADAFKAHLAAEDTQGDVWVLCAEYRGIADGIARRASSSDYVAISDTLRKQPGLFDAASHAALFRSPVGVFLNAAQADRAFAPQRVFLAWNGGLPSARAAHAALPLLRGADQVNLALFDPEMTEHRDGGSPGADAARWLTHHGCRVEVNEYPSGGVEVGESIAKRATEYGADLVVMGAYDHSRAREIILGGTTRTLVRQTDLPVFLAH